MNFSFSHTGYSKFVHKLALSPSKEIRFLRRILISDSRSIIKKNIWFLNNLTRSDKKKISPTDVGGTGLI